MRLCLGAGLCVAPSDSPGLSVSLFVCCFLSCCLGFTRELLVKQSLYFVALLIVKESESVRRSALSNPLQPHGL